MSQKAISNVTRNILIAIGAGFLILFITSLLVLILSTPKEALQKKSAPQQESYDEASEAARRAFSRR